MELPQHLTQSGRDTLGQKDWNARSDAQEFDVRDGPEAAQEILQFLIAEQQRIAAAQEHITNGRGAPDVVDLILEVRMEIIAGGIADEA